MHVLAQQLAFTGIPLFLLAFGILYIALAYLLHPIGVHLAVPIAALAVAASLGWFILKGSLTGGGIFLPSEVLTLLGIGIVGIVLAKVFSGR